VVRSTGHSGPTPYRCPQPILHTTMDGLQNSALESEIAKSVAFHQYLHSHNLSGSFLVSHATKRPWYPLEPAAAQEGGSQHLPPSSNNAAHPIE